MTFKKQILKDAYAIFLSFRDKNKNIAWAYLYIMSNKLHQEPFGFLENVFVEKEYRGSGLGTKIVKKVIAEAKKHNCYKLIGTSRTSRPEVHRLYRRLGFKNHGIEFRMDLTVKGHKSKRQ